MTDAALLDRLRTAWNKPPEPPGTHITHSDAGTTVEPVSLSVGELDSIKAAGVALNRCRWHVQPFDAVEEPDRRRPGWIRSRCRLCGALLGYRPPPKDVTLNEPKLGTE